MNSNNPEENYQFSVDIDETSRLFFLEIEDGKPVKIGDGTYGVVFACTNSQEEAFAVKLFYEPERKSALAEQRFQDEMHAGILIRRNLRGKDRTAVKYVSVIEIEGGTDQFKESLAYKSFTQFFEALKVSQYALVTPRFEKTLKQVLEESHVHYLVQQEAGNQDDELIREPLPINKNKNIVEKEIERISVKYPLSEDGKESLINRIIKRKFTGYDILRHMNFGQRIRTILPYLKDIAQGLRTLHEAKFLHLDVKTANILVRTYATEFQAVIGDLGFLKSQDYQILEQPPLIPGASSDFPLGTRHYRSPEQKDYFDIADSSLRIDNGYAELCITDPKFHDTIIQPEDFVFLNKYKIAFKIDSISHDEEATTVVKFTPTSDDIKLLENDERTQVVFYKRQRYRTDLFGFGAIAFDLITCGQSPERFYELLKGYDRSNMSVSTLVERYSQVSSFRSGDANLSELFTAFRLYSNPAEYAPREIVELILKCILYNASETFYTSEVEARPETIMDEVLKAIRSLEREYVPIELAEENKLYSGTMPTSSFSNQSVGSSFQKKIELLCNIPPDKFLLRLIEGIGYFEELSGLVRNTLKGGNENYISELNPQNIEVYKSGSEDKLKFKSSLYKNEDVYLDDIREDLLYTKINAELRDEYTPHYFAFIRRKIWLRKNSKFDIKGSQKSLEWQYEFKDSSLYGDRLKIGDWLLQKGVGGANKIYRVTSLQSDSKSLSLQEFKGPSATDNASKISANLPQGVQGVEVIYYEHIDPNIYYLQLLGSYIYQLFFVNIGSNEHENLVSNLLTVLSSPQVAEIILIKSTEDNLPKVEKSRKRWPNFGGKNQPLPRETSGDLSDIVDQLITMYLKLTFSESLDSYWSHRKEISALSALRSDIDLLKQKIAQLLNPKYTNWQFVDDKTSTELEKEIEKLSDSSNGYKSVSFNFYDLACSRLTIKTSPRGSFLNLLLSNSNSE